MSDMASAGMLHRGRNSGPESGDEVQRSLELLDSVLSEFEEGDRVSVGGGVASEVPGGGGAVGGVTTASVTPDDDSPSLGGHQSEDDGYMSMNGRRTKFALSFRPTDEKGEPVITAESAIDISPSNASDVKTTSLESECNGEPLSPPPPSEAERIISTLLPKVSPSNSAKKGISPTEPEKLSPAIDESLNSIGTGTNSSTQTTLPKTRHQRPYGWEKCTSNPVTENTTNQSQCKFSSLQHGSHQSPTANPLSWLPPRQKRDERTNKVFSAMPTKKSPSVEFPKTPFPLVSGFSYENDFVLGDMPYNEHPVTIYPGANVPYTKQLNSPTYGPPKNSVLSASFTGKSSTITQDMKIPTRRENNSDGEMLSPANKVPPRTLAGSMERHREVCRRAPDNVHSSPAAKKIISNSTEDEEHFSDDSLEETFPPPPQNLTPSKRSSIAWEVPLDGDDPLLTPGSTKVIVVGRRRRKSGDQSNSSTSSIPQRVEEWISEGQGDFWPPPPMQCSTEDEIVSPFSDTNSDRLPLPEDISEINATGTYIIRRGKKDRKNLPQLDKKSHKPPRNIQQHIENNISHKSLERDQSIDGSSLSISGLSTSGSHNSVSSLNSRLSSDLSIPHTRYSIDFNNSRFSRELSTPNSRFSVDLCMPQANSLKKELTSPKSRLSLDLNNSQDKFLIKDFFHGSPRNKKLTESNGCFANKNSTIPAKLSPQNRFTDYKKYSCTFDNIQSLMKEGVESTIQCNTHFNETSTDLEIVPPSVVRVVSLPSLSAEPEAPSARQILTTTVEEEEDFETPSHSSEDNSPLKKIENNISALLSQGRDHQFTAQYMPKDWDIHKDEYCNNTEISTINCLTYNSGERHRRNEIQKSSSHNEIPNKRLLDYHRDKPANTKRNGIHKSLSSKDMPMSLNRQASSSESTGSSGADFPIHVNIVEHSFKPHSHDFGPLPNSPGSPQFPPLPPSPVQEDDEYSEILQPLDKVHISKNKDVLPSHNIDIYHRSLEAPIIPPHREPTTNSLKTRSMDTGFSKNRRNNNSNKTMSTDRRTLPSDMGVMSGRRRTLQRQRGREEGSAGTGLQTSASLPETPVFGRGIDVPRTPHRRTTDGPRLSNTMNSIQTISGSCTVGGYGRGTGSMERAIAGAELLRLAGGPARGWYPRQRHRPASIEHLERLPMSASSTNSQTAPWDSSRKPLTLPPNLTPKFFQKSPREALRRVTSLLIRKGNSSKESSKKERQAVSPATRSANGEESAQKQRKGFFKSFWKRSRHYSLEHP